MQRNRKARFRPPNDVKTSMKADSHKISQNYATALYQLSQEQQCTQQVLDNLQTLHNLIQTNTALQHMLFNPFTKSQMLHTIFVKLLAKIEAHPLTKSFIGIVIRNRRARMLSQLLDSFMQEIDKKASYARLKLHVALPLTSPQHQKFSKVLQKIMNREVYFDVTVDPSLLGGFILHIGSRMIEASFQSKIQALYNTLSKKSSSVLL